MRQVARTWLVVACLLGGAVLTLGAPTPVVAENPCAPRAPTFAAEVRGQAWSGVVLGIKRQRRPAGGGWDTATITFRVERVYRDRPHVRRGAVDLAPGGVITIFGEGCSTHPALGLKRGDRYLFSTGTLWREPSWPGTNISTAAAWRLHGDRATLVKAMYFRNQRDELWPGFAEADTLAEVLAIVAPNAPATDAVTAPVPGVPSTGNGPPWPVALAGGAGAWLVLRRARRSGPPAAPADPRPLGGDHRAATTGRPI
jgi:hypothetical protein